MGLKKENQGAMTKCTIISSQLLFLLGYFINGLSNKCIYWFCLKTSKPRFARELHLIPWLRQDLLLRSKVNTLKPSSACWKTLLPRFARRNATHPPDLFRNCTPFALRALPSVGGSSAMRNEKNQIYFVLNLYRHLPRLGRRVKPCCARKGSPGNGISIFPSLCIYILFIII